MIISELERIRKGSKNLLHRFCSAHRLIVNLFYENVKELTYDSWWKWTDLGLEYYFQIVWTDFPELDRDHRETDWLFLLIRHSSIIQF